MSGSPPQGIQKIQANDPKKCEEKDTFQAFFPMQDKLDSFVLVPIAQRRNYMFLVLPQLNFRIHRKKHRLQLIAKCLPGKPILF